MDTQALLQPLHLQHVIPPGLPLALGPLPLPQQGQRQRQKLVWG